MTLVLEDIKNLFFFFFFLQLVLNYKNRLNSNFAYGICVIFKHGRSKEELLYWWKTEDWFLIIELYHLISKNQKLNYVHFFL